MAGCAQDDNLLATVNLIRIPDGSNAVILLGEGDAVNELLAIQSAETAAAGMKRSEFAHHGGGRRVRHSEKEHNGSAWVTPSDWRYVWGGLELAQKRNAASNAVLMAYFGSGEQQEGIAFAFPCVTV